MLKVGTVPAPAVGHAAIGESVGAGEPVHLRLDAEARTERQRGIEARAHLHAAIVGRDDFGAEFG
jgi:hypothetical protein